MDPTNTTPTPPVTPEPSVPEPDVSPQPVTPEPLTPITTSAPDTATEPAATPDVPAAAPAWAQYVGNIVRWEDGTSWLVKEDGRHWIPDGGVYQALEQKGATVFNLASPELDAIPDIKDSPATV